MKMEISQGFLCVRGLKENVEHICNWVLHMHSTKTAGVENPRGGREARNFTTNVPEILDLKWSSEQIFSKN